MRRLLGWINEKWKINWKVPYKWTWASGADIDGDMIYVAGHQYFYAWGVIHEIGIVDVIRAYWLRLRKKTWFWRYPMQ